MTSSAVLRSTLSWSVLGAAVIVVLSGCFTLRMDLMIQADDTVDGSILVAVDDSLVEAAGGEDALVESLTSGDNALFRERPTAGEVETDTYSDGERTGVEYTLTGVPLSEFGSTTGSDLSITRVEDTYMVRGALDLSQGLNDSTPETAHLPEAAELLETADVSLSVTFPGEVLESNGEVSGTTVTWMPQAGELLELKATGSTRSGIPIAVAAGVGLLVLFLVVGLVVWLLIRPR